MKALRIAGIPAMLILCVGMALGQDATHDTDKAATTTGHAVKQTGKKVGHVTKWVLRILPTEPNPLPKAP